jgi:hypothetical protein
MTALNHAVLAVHALVVGPARLCRERLASLRHETRRGVERLARRSLEGRGPSVPCDGALPGAAHRVGVAVGELVARDPRTVAWLTGEDAACLAAEGRLEAAELIGRVARLVTASNGLRIRGGPRRRRSIARAEDRPDQGHRDGRACCELHSEPPEIATESRAMQQSHDSVTRSTHNRLQLD